MQFDWIEPQILAASGIPVGLQSIRSLKEQGIGAIVSLTEYPITQLQREVTPQALEALDIIYHHAPTPDTKPLTLETAQAMVQFIAAMRAQGRATLVHCAGGIGRTGTALHFYYLAQGDTLEDAKRKVKKRRKICQFTMLTQAQQAFLVDFAQAKLNQEEDKKE